MRKTKGYLNDKEFIKVKPDLPQNGVRGIVTAQLIDSATGRVVQESQSENLITDIFYEYASMFAAEDFVNGYRQSGSNASGSGNSPMTPNLGATAYSRAAMYSTLVLSKTEAAENSRQGYLGGEIAGSVGLGNTSILSNTYAGRLRDVQEKSYVDDEGNIHFNRLYEWNENQMNDRPFNTLFWMPGSPQSAGEICPNSSYRYDEYALGALSRGAIGSTTLPFKDSNFTYQIPAGVTIGYWANRWDDMPYRFASRYLSNTLTIYQFDNKTGALINQTPFVTSGDVTYNVYHGGEYVAFIANMFLEEVSTYRKRAIICNNKTGQVYLGGSNTSFPVGNARQVISHDKRLWQGTNFPMTYYDADTGEAGTFNTDNIQIPQWLYPESGVKPTVVSTGFYPGVDTFDVYLSGTYFGYVFATFNWDGTYKAMAGTYLHRYRGIGFDARPGNSNASVSPKTIPAKPSVMYKFPAMITKNKLQIFTLKYEMVVPHELCDISNRYLW